MIDKLEKSTILVVDDTPDNLMLISKLLKDIYNVKVVNSGKKALDFLQKHSVDLVLLDIIMPEMDGYEVLEKIKKDKNIQDIPVIFLTAKSTVEDEEKGLSLGANDYITKPITAGILKARVKTQLENKIFEDFLKDQSSALEKIVEDKTKEIVAIQDVTITAMGSLAETRDNDTGDHIRRTQNYVKILALYLKNHDKFSEYLTDDTINTLYKSAPLHDIGKVGIPDKILLKPSLLSDEEFTLMKSHTTLGYEAILNAEKELGFEVDFFKTTKEIALYHHEKYDGSGYPMGLKGENIPISARLMAVADVYDALISNRCYKKGLQHEIAVDIILEEKGKHFDPDIVDAFEVLKDEFHKIALKFKK